MIIHLTTITEHIRKLDFLEVDGGAANDGQQVRARSRNSSTEVSRHNQEWYIYLVNGAGGIARIALQNVMSGTFLNLSGADSPRDG